MWQSIFSLFPSLFLFWNTILFMKTVIRHVWLSAIFPQSVSNKLWNKKYRYIAKYNSKICTFLVCRFAESFQYPDLVTHNYRLLPPVTRCTSFMILANEGLWSYFMDNFKTCPKYKRTINEYIPRMLRFETFSFIASALYWFILLMSQIQSRTHPKYHEN